MSARSRSEAKDNFGESFKESLSCLCDAYLHPVQISQNRYLLTYEPSAPVLCKAGERTLDVTHLFRIAPDEMHGGFKAITLQYGYTLNAEVSGTWKELVSYHWHPEETEVRDPHLHVGYGCFPRVHFPTRRVSVERFISMLLAYFDILPLLHEQECARILNKNNEAFEAMSSWE